MENFMIGYPGAESGFRKAVSDILGNTKGGFIFEYFQHNFLGDADLKFIKSLGCNLMRVASNYRHFEDDENSGKFKPEGFAWLEKVIEWGRAARVYVVLDFHAVQGWQSSSGV